MGERGGENVPEKRKEGRSGGGEEEEEEEGLLSDRLVPRVRAGWELVTGR